MGSLSFRACLTTFYQFFLDFQVAIIDSTSGNEALVQAWSHLGVSHACHAWTNHSRKQDCSPRSCRPCAFDTGMMNRKRLHETHCYRLNTSPELPPESHAT